MPEVGFLEGELTCAKNDTHGQIREPDQVRMRSAMDTLRLCPKFVEISKILTTFPLNPQARAGTVSTDDERIMSLGN